MKSDLTALQFSESELTDLTGISLSESLSGHLCQNPVIQTIVTGKIKQNRQILFSLIFYQGIVLLLTLILSLPLALILTNQTQFSPTSSQTLLYFVQIVVIVSVLLTISINIWIKWKIKPFITAIKLLEEVQKYQEVIQAVHVLDPTFRTSN